MLIPLSPVPCRPPELPGWWTSHLGLHLPPSWGHEANRVQVETIHLTQKTWIYKLFNFYSGVKLLTNKSKEKKSLLLCWYRRSPQLVNRSITLWLISMVWEFIPLSSSVNQFTKHTRKCRCLNMCVNTKHVWVTVRGSYSKLFLLLVHALEPVLPPTDNNMTLSWTDASSKIQGSAFPPRLLFFSPFLLFCHSPQTVSLNSVPNPGSIKPSGCSRTHSCLLMCLLVLLHA